MINQEIKPIHACSGWNGPGQYDNIFPRKIYLEYIGRRNVNQNHFNFFFSNSWLLAKVFKIFSELDFFQGKLQFSFDHIPFLRKMLEFGRMGACVVRTIPCYYYYYHYNYFIYFSSICLSILLYFYSYEYSVKQSYVCTISTLFMKTVSIVLALLN